MNNKNHQTCQQNEQTPNNSQINLQTNISSNTIQLNYNDNIDTDYDDNTPSSSSSNTNQQILVYKKDDDEEESDEEELLQDDYEQDDNVMIIERRCFDDELDYFQQEPLFTSTSPQLKNKQNEDGKNKQDGLKQVQQSCQVQTPNTAKNAQISKFSFYSNDQPLLTHKSSNSPVLKEVTSNFQNIKPISNNNVNNVSQQIGQIQSKSQNQQKLNTQAYPPQQSQNQQRNYENILTSKNECTNEYNINFKICPQKSKENKLGVIPYNKVDQIIQSQQQNQLNDFSQSIAKNQTPQTSLNSIPNKTQKNILQETLLHTKSFDQNLEQIMDVQKSTEYSKSGTPIEMVSGNDLNKKDITQRSLTAHQNQNKNEAKILKTLPCNNIVSPYIHNLQHQFPQTNQNSTSGRDKYITEKENKEQSFQISQNLEFESVTERKNQIKVTMNQVPYQDKVNELLMGYVKPSQTPTDESKKKREFNICLLKKQLTDTINFFEGNNRNLNDIVDKYQKQVYQQQTGKQYQNPTGQLTLLTCQQGQQHRINLHSNQMTPQSILNTNTNHPQQNYQNYPQVSKQTNQIQMLFQATPPPPPSHHTQQQIQSQLQINGQNPFGQQQSTSQQSLMYQQYQHRNSSQYNNFNSQNQHQVQQQQQGTYPLNVVQNNQQQFTNVQQQSFGRQNVFQPPLVPLKSATSQRGAPEINGGRSISTYCRESTDGQMKTMYKRMRANDICTRSSISSSIPNNFQNKNLNSTIDENINNSNNVSCLTLNTSKLNLNQQGSNSNNVSCLIPTNNENNRYLTNSSNQITYSNQSTSQDPQTRKRNEYSFPDLKSFNKYIKKV